MAIKIIRFSNGDEIIGDADVVSTDSIDIKNPASIGMVPGQIQGQASLGFAPFMPYAENKTFSFNINMVMTIADPKQELINEYNRIFGSGIVVAKNFKV